MRNVLLVAALISVIFFHTGVAPADEGNPQSLSSGGAERQETDGKGHGKIVVALVNGVEITMESLEIMMKSLGTGKGPGTALPENIGAVKKEALNQLILQELAYQKAKSEGLTVEQEDIDKAIADMKRKLGDESKYREFLDKEGISEDELRQRIQKNLILKRIFTREILDKKAIPEEELKKEYEQDKEIYTKPEKIVVVDVVFFLRIDDADSLKKAEEILEKIHADKEKNPWNLVLDGTFVVRDLEIKEGGQEKEIYGEAKKLKAGELSGVFPSSGTFHIIKLKEYAPFKQFTFEEVKSGVERKYRAQAQKKRLLEWEAELKKNAKIEIIETGDKKSK
ncbi:MAG: SurA N-terminal domain-containing protein [Nitrospirae bacterium]|nr:SurA N-terminal domain-containing protein [Nitrospirota bacterium]